MDADRFISTYQINLLIRQDYGNTDTANCSTEADLKGNKEKGLFSYYVLFDTFKENLTDVQVNLCLLDGLTDQHI